MRKINTVFTASMFPLLLSATPRETEKPNILFLLLDDLQTGAIAALGNKDVYTPNIDKLYAQGVSFTSTYTNGALCGALSMPSRAMLMTGRNLFEVQSDGMKIPECMTTFPEHLRANGYQTFATGKWHSDHASFNRSFTTGENIFFGGMHRYETNGHYSPRLHHYDATAKYDNSAFNGEEFSSKMFADAAIAFLDNKETGNQVPFMAFVSFTSPHDPRNQLPDYGKKYTAESITVPANFLPQHPFDNGELAIRDEMVLPPPRTREQIKSELAFYYGMVSEVDEQIGRVIQALERTGRKQNTIIVFASDNGLAMGQNGLLGKQSLYDHSVKVPLLIVDPRKTKSRSSENALCYLSDIYPTLCDMTGVEIPSTVTGLSLKPVLDGTAGKLRDDIFLAYSNQQRALVKDDFKYIIYNVQGAVTEQLFNLKDDPGELTDLSGVLPEKVAGYKTLLGQRMKERNDFCNLNTPLWWKDGHKISWDELIRLYLFE